MKPTGKIEEEIFKTSNFIIGVDEVGLGCLAGPVVACSFLISKKDFKRIREIEDIKDSKLLSLKKRELVARILKNNDFKYSISRASSSRIDKVGIFNAVQEIMKDSIMKIIRDNNISEPVILIDGNRRLKNFDLNHQVIVKGDQKVFAIASASIIAKVYRDSLMDKYDLKYSGYGFGVHKGYGTKKHRQAIKKLGPCLIHRKSYTLL